MNDDLRKVFAYNHALAEIQGKGLQHHIDSDGNHVFKLVEKDEVAFKKEGMIKFNVQMHQNIDVSDGPFLHSVSATFPDGFPEEEKAAYMDQLAANFMGEEK